MILLHKIGFQAKKEARKCPALYFGTMCKYFIYDKIIVYNAQVVSRRQMSLKNDGKYKFF